MADMGTRFWAGLSDLVGLSFITTVVLSSAVPSLGLPEAIARVEEEPTPALFAQTASVLIASPIFTVGAGLLVSALYFPILWALVGGTLAQRLFGMRVTDVDGDHVSLFAAFARWVVLIWPAAFAFALSAVLVSGPFVSLYLGPLVLGLIYYGLLVWSGSGATNRAWHDRISGSFVRQVGPVPERGD